MFAKNVLFTLLMGLVLYSPTNLARKWEAIKIPGAKYGNGMDYRVFLYRKDKTKLAVEFMGGGVCWNTSTCYRQIFVLGFILFQRFQAIHLSPVKM
jgi:hypothetical protein